MNKNVQPDIGVLEANVLRARLRLNKLHEPRCKHSVSGLICNCGVIEIRDIIRAQQVRIEELEEGRDEWRDTSQVLMRAHARDIKSLTKQVERVLKLAETWTQQQSEYPPEGAMAASTVRLCVEELLAALGEGE